METSIYDKTLVKSRATLVKRVIAGIICLVFGILLLFLQAEAFGVLTSLFAVFLLGWGIVGQLLLAKHQRRMAAFGVDDAAKQSFDREYNDRRLLAAPGHKSLWDKNVGTPHAALTQSWFYNRKPASTVLLPLRELVWYYKRVARQDGGATNLVMLIFSDGSVYSVFGGDQSLLGHTDTTGEWLRALQTLCPHALSGFSEARDKAYMKDRLAFAADIKKGNFYFDK